MHEATISKAKIVNGDCLEVMRETPDNSIDAVVTDPPYGLSFMGKNWDHGIPGKAFWKEALRVAKPGAYLLAFGGTRTYHRLTCAIEDAGWEIRDCVGWLYGSGFPKSMDVAKAIDKASGYKGEVIGRKVVDIGMQGGNMHAGRSVNLQEREIRELSDEAREWEGWGTALKPAWEPVIMARKPLDGTVANTVTTWGTGAINIDASRVPTNGESLSGGVHAGSAAEGWRRPFMEDEDSRREWESKKKGRQEHATANGRFPANIIHDGSEEVLRIFPESKGQQADVRGTESSKPGKNCYGNYGNHNAFAKRGDSGSAARFFYCAKASKKERGEGNDHPTVKPQALMRYLVRMITREGATVLDPFMGSGSTGLACLSENRSFIGIEREQDYCKIAKKRLEDLTNRKI